MGAPTSSIDSIFCAALEIASSDERAAYLARACEGDAELRRRVEQLLLAHFKAGGFLESPVAGFAPTVDMPEIAEQPGTVIGPYKLLEQIGEGGFGIVYMADQQAPVRRRVALKIIKPGMDTRQVLARFKAELQALSLMDHPNIARVLDAGATDSGRPYFVMELIRGVPITDYCDRNNLPVHERLDLFVQVCHAVQHAHQKGVIHRDIKPSNVLITLNDGRPVPKVIDFGVAKALNQQLTQETLFTRFAEMIGTPLYMSPEQAEMTSLDIDTRADIYSLGVLLYELLTGSTPFEKDRLRQAAYDEIRRIIRQEEPPRPSLRISSLGDTRTAVAAHRQIDPHRLSQLVQGDLDWIVMKALEKDRTRRYDTASNFAADVLRHLSDQPVEACPPSAIYRFGKFARRNRVAFMTAMVLLAAILVGAVVSTWQAIRATRAERLAQTRLEAETEAHDEAEVARRVAVRAGQSEAAHRQIAESARQTEARQRQVAESARAQATRQLYLSQMNLAEKHWNENHARRARELLESQMPVHTGGVDLRGWEWHYLWRLSHSELRRLQFTPNRLAFSSDGQLLVAGSSFGTLRMWDASGIHAVRTIKAHSRAIDALGLSRDGRVIATTSRDGTAKLWEVATGREVRTFPGGGCLALSPDGHQLAIATDVITIWDTSSGKDLRTLKGHAGTIRAVAFSPDGQRLASGGSDDTVRHWDVTTGRQLWLVSGQPEGVFTIAFSPDGKTVVLGTIEDGVIKALDAETGRQAKTFTGHKDRINGLAFNRNGTRLASASNDWTVKVWDPVSGGEIQTLRGHIDNLRAVAVSPRDDLIASGGDESTIHLWDTASRQEPTSLPHPGPVSSIAYSGDGKLLAIGGGDVIAVRDASTDQRLWEEAELISSNVRFDPTSRSLASGLEDGRVCLRNAQDGRVLRTFKAHDSRITRIDFSSDGRVLATGGDDKRVALWNPVDGRRLATLNGHTDSVKAVAFSPDGKLLASAGAENDRTVRIWDVSMGRAVRTIPIVHLTPSADDEEKLADDKDYSIWSMVFRHDARQQLFTAIGGNTNALDFIISCWDIQTGKTTRVYQGHAYSVSGLSLSPDGRRLASCSDDGCVKIWDVDTAQEVLTLHPKTHVGRISSVAFSPDGTRLAAGASDHVLVWDARPLTDELRAVLNDVNRVESLTAENLVESLFAEHLVKENVIAALRADTTISESVRNKAIDRARKMHGSPGMLNSRSWSLVSQPGRRADQYQFALRCAEEAASCDFAAGHWAILNTLGVAQYRVGKYAEAVETLSRSDEINTKSKGTSLPGGIAVQAMAHYQLGHVEEARKLLERLPQLMQMGIWRGHSGSQDLVAEARQLIRSPVHAEPPAKQRSTSAAGSR